MLTASGRRCFVPMRERITKLSTPATERPAHAHGLAKHPSAGRVSEPGAETDRPLAEVVDQTPSLHPALSHSQP